MNCFVDGQNVSNIYQSTLNRKLPWRRQRRPLVHRTIKVDIFLKNTKLIRSKVFPQVTTVSLWLLLLLACDCITKCIAMTQTTWFAPVIIIDLLLLLLSLRWGKNKCDTYWLGAANFVRMTIKCLIYCFSSSFWPNRNSETSLWASRRFFPLLFNIYRQKKQVYLIILCQCWSFLPVCDGCRWEWSAVPRPCSLPTVPTSCLQPHQWMHTERHINIEANFIEIKIWLLAVKKHNKREKKQLKSNNTVHVFPRRHDEAVDWVSG